MRKPQPQASREAFNVRQGNKPKKPKQHTVKKGETYQSLAEKYNQPQEALIQTAGIKNLTPGAVINLPEQLGPTQPRRHPDQPAPVAQPSRRDVLSQPGYGGTIEDYELGGATFTKDVAMSPAQKDAAMRDFRAQEAAAGNEAKILADWERLKSGKMAPRGPEATRIRAAYNQFLEDNPGYYDVDSQAPDAPPVGREIISAGRDLLNLGTSPDPNNPLALQAEDRATVLEALPADVGEYIAFMFQGGSKRYNNETGEIETIPFEGESMADALAREGQERRAKAKDEYYSKMLSSIDPEDVDVIKNNTKPQYGEPFSPEGYPTYTEDMRPDWVPEGTDTFVHEGNVYYAKDGRVIPQEDFLDYLEANKKHYDNLEDYMNSPEGQKHIFVSGTQKDMEAIHFAILNDDRNMLPDFLTPAQLQMWDSSRDWNDYMANVLNYRYDAEKGQWIKQEIDESIPLLGYGGGGGGGYGGGYGAASDWKAGSSNVQRGGTGAGVRSDARFAQQQSGIAPIHWRL